MNLREQKILNAIKYFVKNTNHVGRTKLFKLLYYWDIYYFEKHGKTITSYKYLTYPFGPVPKELFDQINEDKLPDFLKKEILIIDDTDTDTDDGFKKFKIALKNKNIDLDVFTPYEKEYLTLVVEIFKDAPASLMSEATHFPNTPWKITLDKKGKFQEIDFLLAKSKDTPFDEEEIKERMYFREQLLHNGYN